MTTARPLFKTSVLYFANQLQTDDSKAANKLLNEKINRN